MDKINSLNTVKCVKWKGSKYIFLALFTVDLGHACFGGSSLDCCYCVPSREQTSFSSVYSSSELLVWSLCQKVLTTTVIPVAICSFLTPVQIRFLYPGEFRFIQLCPGLCACAVSSLPVKEIPTWYSTYSGRVSMILFFQHLHFTFLWFSLIKWPNWVTFTSASPLSGFCSLLCLDHDVLYPYSFLFRGIRPELCRPLSSGGFLLH